MNDQTLCKRLPNGCQVRISWSSTDRRYRAELSLPDGELLRHSAPAPDGMARLIAWAQKEAEKGTIHA